MDSTTFGQTTYYSTDDNDILNYCDHNGRRYVIINEIDIFYNGFSYDWFFTTDITQKDTTKSDFWTISLHEFGHSHFLEHQNLPSSMKPYWSIGEDDRDLDDDTENGGKWIMDTIEVISPICGVPIVKNFNGCITSTFQPINNIQYLKAYPNPLRDYITIEFDSKKQNIPFSISLISVDGRVIKTLNGQTNYGINRYEFSELSSISSGLYFLRLTVNEEVTFAKVVKF